ncbi:MAG: PaaI family thioesterase [Deltaproteobacteria bacterium]|nr:PaaI family thioesterase [Deltaproteobacteria bacterium]MBW1927679.1 PaaI family thioesterase [Deltaproteobacteria bacterium]MBW2026330.1 PaaI family thioesterase [Deltaproteobacteria bacterium]
MSQKNKAKRLNPAYLEEVFRHVNTCPYFQLLSIEIRALDWGRSHLQARVQEKHLQPYGMVHGGVCASLVDAACFWATWTQVEGEAGLTTVELKLNYLAPVSAGLLIARGRSIKTGRTLCLSEASVENEKGALIAHGTSTLMVLESLRIGGQSHQVPKYLDIEAP